MKSYEIIDKVNAVTIKVAAASIDELFANVAKAITHAMIGTDQVAGERFSKQIKINSVDEETLLVDWVSKLLELAYMENVAFSNVVVEKLDTSSITASLEGCYVYGFAQELGGLDLDRVALKKNDEGFEATLTFGF